MLCDRSGNDSVLGATTRKISEASHRPTCVRAAPCFRFASPDAVPSRPSPGDAVSMKTASLPSTSLEPAHRPVRRRLACHRLPCRRMHHCRRPSPSCPEPSRATSPGAASAPEAFPRCLAWRLLTPEPPPPPPPRSSPPRSYPEKEQKQMKRTAKRGRDKGKKRGKKERKKRKKGK
jgi:hypothetical protein